jgi:hypothetical protein
MYVIRAKTPVDPEFPVSGLVSATSHPGCLMDGVTQLTVSVLVSEDSGDPAVEAGV